MAPVIAPNAEPIPGYTLVELLGRGGFAEVWKAIAPGGIPKAIKIAFGSLDEVDGNVPAVQELKALNRVKEVHHSFILGLERIDIVEGRLFIVMELADRNLQHRLEECQKQGQAGIPRTELLRYMAESAEALDLMNGEYQLQHLDIKPANIFLVHRHAKVADFGLVKDLQGRTAAVTSGLTPIYSSPETFNGTVSAFSDQYSLAIVYQELLTGVRPITGKNGRQLAMAHVTSEPDVEPLPPADREIVKRALAKKPEARFPSCTAFVAALKAVSPRLAPGELPPPVSRPATQTAAEVILPPMETPRDKPKPRPAAPVASSAPSAPRPTPPVSLPAGETFARRALPSILQEEEKPVPKPKRRAAPVDEAPPREEEKPVPKPKRRAAPAEEAPPPEMEEKTCPKCGAKLVGPGPSARCSHCDSLQQERADNQAEPAPASSASGRMRLVLIGGILLAAFIAAVGVVKPPLFEGIDWDDVSPIMIASGTALAAVMVLCFVFTLQRKAKPRRKKSGRRKTKARM